MSNNPADKHLALLVTKYPALQQLQKDIRISFCSIRDAMLEGGTLFVCGNGGSAADAEHIVGELLKGFLLRRPLSRQQQEHFAAACGKGDGDRLATHLQGGLRAVSLCGHPSLATAVSNDISADLVFAQQLFALGRPQDVLLAISTSGNALNVRYAVQTAKAVGMSSIGLTGRSGGMLKQLADMCICVPAEFTPDIQELHVPVYHTLCAMLEAAFFNLP